MNSAPVPNFGGPWTREKLAILQKYLNSYTTALKNQKFRLTYVDAFAGAGVYAISSDDYEDFASLKKGSAPIALDIQDKPFDRLIFVEKEESSIASLEKLRENYAKRDIKIIQGDANDKIPNFCNSMDDFDRAVVFLDPYATQVSWSTVEKIASTKKIDCWILFPLMAVTRMMPKQREPDEVIASQLNRIFGGREHWQGNYTDSPQKSLFENLESQNRERLTGKEIADSYRRRLGKVFHKVSKTRRTLKNSKNAPLFELFFAASNPQGAKPAMRIADHILEHW